MKTLIIFSNFILILSFCFLETDLYAQCSSCSTTSTATTGTITVASGTKLCLNTTGTFSGTVNLLAGAMLCVSSSTTYTGMLNLWGTGAQIQNYGTWNTSLNMFNSPTFNNFGTFNVNSLQVQNGATFTSTTDITVANNITNNGTFNVAGNVNCNNFTANPTGNVTIGGNINANNVTTNSSFDVGGNVSVNNFTSNSTGNVTVGGNMNANNVQNNGVMGVTGNATYTGTLQNNGTAVLTVGGDATINGNVENNGTLTFQSSATLQNNFTNNGTTTFDTTFAITGNLENNNATLTANGTGTIGGNIVVNSGGNVDFNSSVAITGNVNVNSNGTLDFDADSSVGGNFQNDGGTTTISDAALTITGNLTNNGSLQAGGACGRFNVAGQTRNNSGTVGTNNVQIDICDASANQAAPDYGWDVQFAGAGNFGTNLSYCTCSPTVLPIELLDFSAKNKEDGIELKWITALEKDNNYFLVERLVSNSSFLTIAKIKAKNLTYSDNSTPNSYIFLDDEISTSNTIYYRLKQVDTNGDFTYSPVISALYVKNNTTNWNIRTITWKLEGIEKNEQISVFIYNSIGLKVGEYILTHSSAFVNVANLPKGVYLIRYTEKGKVVTKKVIH